MLVFMVVSMLLNLISVWCVSTAMIIPRLILHVKVNIFEISSEIILE